MPFKTLFRGHKRGKQTTKRGVHFLAEHHSEASEEPPDGYCSISDQSQHTKLHKHEESSRTHKSHHHHHHKNKDIGTSKSRNGDLPQPPLNRASSDPLPVNSEALGRSGRGAGRVRKSCSLGASLDGWEHQLHDRRLRGIIQLENYIKYFQHTSEDEEACHMASRLCCAQMLKTLYLRHEQQYVNFLQHSRSPDSLVTPSPCIHTNSTNHTNHHSDTGLTNLHEDFDFSPNSDCEGIDCHGGRKLQSALKKSTELTSCATSGSFCRQTGSRVPVPPRRHGLRVSLSLTPQMASPEKKNSRSSALQVEDENFGDSQCSLDGFFGENRLTKSAGLTDQSRGCGSNLSLTPFSTMAAFPSNEIY